jgi:hypothetical protein
MRRNFGRQAEPYRDGQVYCPTLGYRPPAPAERDGTTVMRSLAKKNVTVFAVLVAASLVATPLVMSASSALATVDDVSAVAVPVAVVPVEVAPVAAPAVKAEGCTRKVRVVYSGYGTPDAACLAR